MTIEYIKPGEQYAADAGVELVLLFLSMPKEVGRGLQRQLALSAVKRSSYRSTLMVHGMWGTVMGNLLPESDKLLFASKNVACQSHMAVLFSVTFEIPVIRKGFPTADTFPAVVTRFISVIG